MSKRLTKEEFVEKARKVHGDKYDYSKVEYQDNRTKVCIICPQHGEFWQKPNDHLNGCGCKPCSLITRSIKQKMTQEEFLSRAKEIHGDKYDYSKTEYQSATKHVIITCPLHGDFWQTPNRHINAYQGCPTCNESKLENEVRIFLNESKIKFITQKRFDWLGRQSLDFYIEDLKIAIECQGKQHFEKGGWEKSHIDLLKQYAVIKERDERKRNLCAEHGIKILYYSNLGIEYPYKVFEDKDKLLEEIKNFSH